MAGRPQNVPDPSKRPLLTVAAPVADLLSEPSAAAQRLTQLLFNETLRCLGEERDWYMVEALEQQKLTGEGWRGYPGWVRKDGATFIENRPVLDGTVTRGTVASVFSALPVYLSAGTRVEMLPKHKENLVGIRLPGGMAAWVPSADIRPTGAVESPAVKRGQIIETAMSFIGTPYLWGGRSTFFHPIRRDLPVSDAGDASVETGVDCSGLVNLSYSAAGIDIPRDACDQHSAAKPLSLGQLKPADLIFLAPGEGQEVNHVILYLGGERCVEAAETGRPVEVETFTSRFGYGYKDMMRKVPPRESRQIYCGSFLEEGWTGTDGARV